MGEQTTGAIYGDGVPPETAGRLHRAAVTPAELDLLVGVVGHHWPAIDAHVKSHLANRRYYPCTTLPGRLCDRWCPVGGDPDLVAAAKAAPPASLSAQTEEDGR